MKELKLTNLCPIMMYTHFKIEPDNEMEYCTTIEKFASDMKELVGIGYTFLSLKQVFDYIKNDKQLPEKSVCVVFNGGYKSNYTLAYPVLEELEIHADIFITTDFMGMKTHPQFNNFIPHFGWDEAEQMLKSGFVAIHLSWHNIHYNNGLNPDKSVSKMLWEMNPLNEYEPILFWNPLFNKEIKDSFAKHNIKLQITDLLKLTYNAVSEGCLGAFYVHHKVSVLDAIDEYIYLYGETILKEQSGLIKSEIRFNSNKYKDLGSVCLPVDKNPQIKNFLSHAFTLSIIGVNRKEKADLFVINNYIDTIFTPQYNLFDYNNFSYIKWDAFEVCRITRDIINESKIDVISYIINALRCGFYSDIWLDTYYIPGKPSYQISHQTHGLLIFKYNSDDFTFSALTYTNQEQYEEIRVRAEDILLGCSNRYFGYINLLKRNPMERIAYDIKYLYKKIVGYINSDSPDEWNAKSQQRASEQYYNYDASLHMGEYIKNKAKSGWIHTVCLYGFCEHKRCMMWRIGYACKKEKLEFNELGELTDKVNKTTEMIQNQALKFNMTKQNNLVEKIVSNIDLLNQIEKDAICGLLKLLDKKYGLCS